MKYRTVARLDWPLSEVSYGMWGMGGWTGSNDDESARALDRAVELGCSFFDTAWAYGEGRSERLLGALLRRHPRRRLVVATKVPPMNRRWPGSAQAAADAVFPYEHVMDYTQKSRTNLGVETIDVQQFHVWDDSWTPAEGWQRAVRELKQSGRVRAFGISVNRWEPENVLRALDTGLIDSVQVVYNIFDQAPAATLFPVCERLGVAVIARVPFDEGSLTGQLTRDSSWPEGDWRNIYFAEPHRSETLRRVEPLKELAAREGTTLPDLALRFILMHRAVTTTIPGMRRVEHVESNLAASTAAPLKTGLVAELEAHAWTRTPASRR